MNGIVRDRLQSVAASHTASRQELRFSQKRGVALTVLCHIEIQFETDRVSNKHRVVKIGILDARRFRQSPCVTPLVETVVLSPPEEASPVSDTALSAPPEEESDAPDSGVDASS